MYLYKFVLCLANQLNILIAQQITDMHRAHPVSD